MKTLILSSLCLLASTGVFAAQDLTMYITPDYGGCTGRIDFQYCNMTTFNITWDGVTSTVSPMSGTTFTTICSGTHTMNFAASNMSGDLYYFSATFNFSPSSPSVSISSASPSPPLTVLYTKVSASSPLCNGVAHAYVSNGTPPYAIQWYNASGIAIPGETTDTIDSLCAGNIGLLVTDAYAPCSPGAGSPVMRSISALTCDIAITPASCYGACDGTAVMTFSSYPSTSTIMLSSSTHSGSATYLGAECAGPVNGSVTDATGQSNTCMSVIPEPSEIVLNITATDPESSGMSNGAIHYTVSASGSVSVTWSSAAGSGTGTSTDITGIPTGDYAVTASTGPGCSVTDSVHVSVITTVPHLQNQLFKVYPNPFSAQLNIECDQAIKKMVVSDVSGKQTVFPANGTLASIDLSSLHTGAYILTVETVKGEILRQEILKER